MASEVDCECGIQDGGNVMRETPGTRAGLSDEIPKFHQRKP